MSKFRTIDREELKEMLHKNWLTHDAMWFYHCAQEIGFEKANKINSAAVKSMAAVEMKRIKKALGVEQVKSFEELLDLMEAMKTIIKPNFMKFAFTNPSPDTLRWDWEPGQCFAFKGVSRLGAIDIYDCGIYLRPDTWFDELGLKYEATPVLNGCMMKKEGTCRRDYKFTF